MTQTSFPSSKRQTHKEALLTLLSDGRAHAMDECLRVGGFRYGGRLHELRKEGHVIETINNGDDIFFYRLLVDETQGTLM